MSNDTCFDKDSIVFKEVHFNVYLPRDREEKLEFSAYKNDKGQYDLFLKDDEYKANVADSLISIMHHLNDDKWHDRDPMRYDLARVTAGYISDQLFINGAVDCEIDHTERLYVDNRFSGTWIGITKKQDVYTVELRGYFDGPIVITMCTKEEETEIIERYLVSDCNAPNCLVDVLNHRDKSADELTKFMSWFNEHHSEDRIIFNPNKSIVVIGYTTLLKEISYLNKIMVIDKNAETVTVITQNYINDVLIQDELFKIDKYILHDENIDGEFNVGAEHYILSTLNERHNTTYLYGTDFANLMKEQIYVCLEDISTNKPNKEDLEKFKHRKNATLMIAEYFVHSVNKAIKLYDIPLDCMSFRIAFHSFFMRSHVIVNVHESTMEYNGVFKFGHVD